MTHMFNILTTLNREKNVTELQLAGSKLYIHGASSTHFHLFCEIISNQWLMNAMIAAHKKAKVNKKYSQFLYFKFPYLKC